MPEVYEYSEGFQLKILALLARDKATYAIYKELIKPQYFKNAIHIDIARMLHEHYDREMLRARKSGAVVNAPTVDVLLEELRKLTKSNKKKKDLLDQYVEDIMDMSEMDLSDSEYIKDSISEFGKRRALELAIMESVDILESDDPQYAEIEERVKKALLVGEDLSDLGTDYFSNAEERMAQYAEGSDGVRRVPTGLAGIDRVTQGGLGESELGVIIAPPNRGKSFGLVNIGSGAVLEGYNTVHFTLEMPEKQVTRRYDNRLLKKDFGYLKENSSKALVAIQNMQKHLKAGRLKIKKYRTNECTIDTIRSYLNRLEMEDGFKPDVIVVDYADLISPRKNYSDKRFELESVYLELRDLADEYKCPVWTASQANRGSLDKKVITIADLAEAFNKANIADLMVALCQTTEEKEDGIMRWHVAKHRNGEANMTLEGDIEYLTAFMTVYADEV